MSHDNDPAVIEEVRVKIEKAHAAFQVYRNFSQARIDAIVEAMAETGRANAIPLAEMAVEETGYGNVPDKIAKNLLISDYLARRMRGMKTVGVLRDLHEERMIEIGVPVGVIAAIVPVTNPTSTAIFKSLISLKAGNSIVISPHPNAKRCTCYTADLLYQAALKAGAPPDIIQSIGTPSLEGTQALMKHDLTGVILATGGSGMVRAAYSSGRPAYGVGPGNVPVLVERTADIKDAIAKIVAGKSFDYGTVCSSEQTLVAEEVLRDQVIAELKARRVYFCNDAQKDALRKLLITPRGTINPKCVGQAPTKIAQMAGFEIPADTSILVTPITEVGRNEPLSAEKLSPVLALYFVKDFAAGCDACDRILHFGGYGHTAVIFSNDDARIREFGLKMPAMRVLVNTQSPQGSTGVTTNIWPSMTLGCGAMAGNITSDNVGPQHLINIKRVAYMVRQPSEAFVAPPYDPGKRVAATVPVAPAAPSGGQREVAREAVQAAVDRYLAQRGILPRTEARSAETRSATVARPAADIVDRFLSARRPAAPEPASPPQPAPSGGSCGSCCGGATGRPAPAEQNMAAAGSGAPAPPAPEVAIVDFVCESDVRTAIQASRKIYIGPKTIVTPAARDLADRNDILVVARR
jgi:acetaldehyde dehydrogenase (acetylating)